MTNRDAVRPAGCPDWCEIDDHDDADGGQGRHSAYETIPLSSYPFTVNGELWHESLIVALDLDLEDVVERDGEPHFMIVPRSEGLEHCMRLTLTEAVALGLAIRDLLEMAGCAPVTTLAPGVTTDSQPVTNPAPGRRTVAARWLRRAIPGIQA